MEYYTWAPFYFSANKLPLGQRYLKKLYTNSKIYDIGSMYSFPQYKSHLHPATIPTWIISGSEDLVTPLHLFKGKQGWTLYLIKDVNLNTLKIGRSNDCKKRLQTLQNATSNKLELIFVIKHKSTIEFEIHKRFNHLRLASEWFKYDESIINLFNELSYAI